MNKMLSDIHEKVNLRAPNNLSNKLNCQISELLKDLEFQLKDTDAEKIKIYSKEDLQNVNNTVSHEVYSKQSPGIVKKDSIGQIKKYDLSKNLFERLKATEDLKTSNEQTSKN